MFSRVLDTARRILSRSPSVQDLTSEAKGETSASHDDADDDDMVTSTRSGPVEDRTPLSSARKTKRTLETEETPVASKKRRKSVPVKEGVSEQSESVAKQVDEPEEAFDGDTIAVRPLESDPETPTQQSVKGKLPIRRRTSPKVIVEKKPAPTVDTKVSSADMVRGDIIPSTQDAEFHTPAAQPASSVYGTPATTLRERRESPTPKAKALDAAKTPAPNKRKSGKKGKEAPTDSQEQAEEQQPELESEITSAVERKFPEEIPSSTMDTEQAALSTQESTQEHIRFGSEEPAGAPTQSEETTRRLFKYGVDDLDDVPKPVNATPFNDDDEASDSDEAPEEVTVASALSKAKAADAEAERAFKAQQEKEKLKRKERADRTAEERAQKRKKEEKKAKKLANLEGSGGSEREIAPLDVDIHKLPDLLPASILEAAGDRRPPTPPPMLPGKSEAEKRKEQLQRHIKFLERGEQPIRDVKKGRLNVHVLAQENKHLAPKVNRNTKNIRERWLKGRQVEQKQKSGKQRMEFRKMERRPMGGGFLRGED